jgi:hypothetical protein
MSKREPKHMGEVMSDIAERYNKLTKTKMSKEDDFKFMLMWLSRNDYLSDDWQILWEEFIKDIKPKQR